jgi:transposase
MTINLLGIDIAKNIFQLHGVDRNGKVVLKKRNSRDRLTEYELLNNHRAHQTFLWR